MGKQLQTVNIKMGHSNINQVKLPFGEQGKFDEGVSSCTFWDVFEHMLKSDIIPPALDFLVSQ